MIGRERETLIARIRQLRRIGAARDERTSSPDAPSPSRIESLETRVAHLEQLLEGLQDSVHRESERQSRMINELQSQIQPGVLGAALSKHARDRGL